jgi:hypothetical protein
MLECALILASFATGCSSHPPSAKEDGNPDDIMTTPGGPSYKANVQQEGTTNPWPPIQTNEVILDDNVHVTYRANIETEAVQTRNNIVYVRTPGQNIIDVKLNAGNVPAGMQIDNGMFWKGPPGTIAQVLQVEISKDVKPGQYSLEIDVNLNGKECGQIPCTIIVI